MLFVASTSVGGKGDKFVQYKATTILVVKTFENKACHQKIPYLVFSSQGLQFVGDFFHFIIN